MDWKKDREVCVYNQIVVLGSLYDDTTRKFSPSQYVEDSRTTESRISIKFSIWDKPYINTLLNTSSIWKDSIWAKDLRSEKAVDVIVIRGIRSLEKRGVAIPLHNEKHTVTSVFHKYQGNILILLSQCAKPESFKELSKYLLSVANESKESFVPQTLVENFSCAYVYPHFSEVGTKVRSLKHALEEFCRIVRNSPVSVNPVNAFVKGPNLSCANNPPDNFLSNLENPAHQKSGKNTVEISVSYVTESKVMELSVTNVTESNKDIKCNISAANTCNTDLPNVHSNVNQKQEVNQSTNIYPNLEEVMGHGTREVQGKDETEGRTVASIGRVYGTMVGRDRSNSSVISVNGKEPLIGRAPSSKVDTLMSDDRSALKANCNSQSNSSHLGKSTACILEKGSGHGIEMQGKCETDGRKVAGIGRGYGTMLGRGRSYSSVNGKEPLLGRAPSSKVGALISDRSALKTNCNSQGNSSHLGKSTTCMEVKESKTADMSRQMTDSGEVDQEEKLKEAEKGKDNSQFTDTTAGRIKHSSQVASEGVCETSVHNHFDESHGSQSTSGSYANLNVVNGKPAKDSCDERRIQEISSGTLSSSQTYLTRNKAKELNKANELDKALSEVTEKLKQDLNHKESQEENVSAFHELSHKILQDDNKNSCISNQNCKDTIMHQNSQKELNQEAVVVEEHSLEQNRERDSRKKSRERDSRKKSRERDCRKEPESGAQYTSKTNRNKEVVSVQNTSNKERRWESESLLQSGQKDKLGKDTQQDPCGSMTGVSKKQNQKRLHQGFGSDDNDDQSLLKVTKQDTSRVTKNKRSEKEKQMNMKSSLQKPVKTENDPCGFERKYYGIINDTCQEKVIILLGASGSGKTTLVNFIANYFKGNKTADAELIHVETTSQTSGITAYTFCSESDDIPITVIDTPGLNDSSGAEVRDHVQSLKTFLANTASKDFAIHAIGFVAQAHLVRLTSSERLVMDYISTMFGQSVSEHLITLVTFADNQDNPPVVEAMQNYGVKFKLSLKFNNSTLSNSKSEEVDDLDRVYWRVCCRNWKKCLKTLRDLPPLSVNTMKAVQSEIYAATVVESAEKDLRAELKTFFTYCTKEPGLFKEALAVCEQIWELAAVVHRLKHVQNTSSNSVENIMVDFANETCKALHISPDKYLNLLSLAPSRSLTVGGSEIIRSMAMIYEIRKNWHKDSRGALVSKNITEWAYCHKCQKEHKMKRFEIGIKKYIPGIGFGADLLAFKCVECKCSGDLHGISEIESPFHPRRCLQDTRNLLRKTLTRHSFPGYALQEERFLIHLNQQLYFEHEGFIQELLKV